MSTLMMTAAAELENPKSLLKLPAEILLGIVNLALTTDEAVNLGSETTEQDKRRIRRQLLRPFGCCRRLWNIAVAEFRPESLVYRLHLEYVKIEASQALALMQPTMMQQVGMGVPTDVTITSTENVEPVVLGGDAGRIRHLELVVPLDIRSCQVQIPAAEQVAGKVQHIYSSLSSIFSALKTLTVRITSYGMGGHETSLWYLATNSQGHARAGSDIVANIFAERIRHHVQAVAGMSLPSLTEREVWLHQKRARDWRCWRDGPLDRPPHTMYCSAGDGKDGYKSLIWHMMDLPSCRMSLDRCIR